MLLRDEAPVTICEYGTNKMIVAIEPTDLIVIENWTYCRLIKKVSQGNIMKNYIAPLPSFDEQRFPFLLCSGYEHFSLINIRDCSM